MYLLIGNVKTKTNLNLFKIVNSHVFYKHKKKHKLVLFY